MNVTKKLLLVISTAIIFIFSKPVLYAEEEEILLQTISEQKLSNNERSTNFRKSSLSKIRQYISKHKFTKFKWIK